MLFGDQRIAERIVLVIIFEQRARQLRAFVDYRRTQFGGWPWASDGPVHAREVFRPAIQYNAAKMLLSHNHPSGVAEPSVADTRITHYLRDALAMIDVRVLDHIVVGAGETASLAESGLL